MTMVMIMSVFYHELYESDCVIRLRMLQAQRQRKMAHKSASQTPVASTIVSTAASEDVATSQNGLTAEMSLMHAVPDTDADSDGDMSSRHAAAATTSHDSDTEVCHETTL